MTSTLASQSASRVATAGAGVAREDRGVDRTDPAEREDRDHGLRQQREQDPDPVPGTDPVCAEAAHGRLDLGQELAVGQPADRAILALPDERLATRVARRPGFGRRARIVERAAAPPACPGRPAARVEHLARPPLPGDPDVVRGRTPEPARDRRPRGPGAPRATARQSRAGTAQGATRGAARVSAATRHPGHPGRRSALQGRWPYRKPSVGDAGLCRRGRPPIVDVVDRSARPRWLPEMCRWSRQPFVLAGPARYRAAPGERGGTDDRGAGTAATATRRGRRRPGSVADAAQPVPPDRDPERGRDRDDPSGVAPDPRRDRRRGARRPGDRPVPRRRRGHRRRDAPRPTRPGSRPGARRAGAPRVRASRPQSRHGTSASAATTSCSVRSAARRS